MKALASALFLSVLIGIFVWWMPQVVRQTAETRYGPILLETRSDFSHIRVRGRESQRSLLFVDDEGREQCQSSLDLAVPGTLQLPYTRALFLSFLFRHPQERVLILGLGGGGMVRFLEKNFPGTDVDAVEIDAEVVRLAREQFGVKEGPGVRVFTADAFDFVGGGTGRYDAIYLDAFLRSPEGTGRGEAVRRLKTREFLTSLRNRIEPGGLVAFNLIEADPRTPEDLSIIGEVFPGHLVFGVAGTGNLAVFALDEAVDRTFLDRMMERASELDRTLGLDFSLAALAGECRREGSR